MEEYQIGRRSVDIYIPDLYRIVEVDGPTHYPKKDRVRDAEILSQRPELQIVHIKTSMPIAKAMCLVLFSDVEEEG